MSFPGLFLSGARRMAAFPMLALMLGCASEGPLRPPSLHLPAAAEKLTVERRGGQAILDWTTPEKTTDGEAIKGPMAADVCLDLAPDEAPAPPKKGSKLASRKSTGTLPPERETACLRVAHVAAAPGAAGHAEVELGGLATGAPRLVAYQIELENAQGRSAGVSAAAYVAAGAAPAAVTGLAIAPRREAALVTWKTEPGNATMELKRTLVATAAGPVTAAAEKAKGGAALPPGAPKGEAREVVLRAEGTTAKDSGGMIDATVRDGDTYTYIAQRVATVTLGAHRLELRGAPSAPVTFSFRDTFPPRVPTGLVLVPGGGFGEAASMDLVWDANFEPDLLGYNVYRSTDGGSFERLNAAPLTGPSYRDMKVEPGRRYTYRVTAIDQRKNESAPSAVASETLRR